MNAALPPPRRPHPPPPAPGEVVPGHALDWLAAGWRIFMRAPLVWALQALIFFVILAALGMVPFLGWAAAPVTLPVLVAGMLSGARALDRGEPLHVGQLFDGLRQHAGNLLLVGLFHLLGLLLAALAAAAIGGSAMLTGDAQITRNARRMIFPGERFFPADVLYPVVLRFPESVRPCAWELSP